MTFQIQADAQMEILSRKVLAGTYKFTKYKLKLVGKGRGRYPREISIPTVRDRIALRALCDFLSARFGPSIKSELPQNVIRNIKGDVKSGRYSGFVKLDVSNFYPSIDHEKLKSSLRKRVSTPEITSIIEEAISTPTVSKPRKFGDVRSSRGVPQGLAVSNVLASIYLINIDRKMGLRKDISYYRYVDDILILCDYSKVQEIARDVISQFKKLGLEIHDPIKTPEKSSIGQITNKFDYLGYEFNGHGLGVRLASIERLKSSLVAAFTAYKYSSVKNQKLLIWRLNLRITGCVFENKAKGWLLFFSEIDDEQLLHSLDHYVKKLCERFNVEISLKKFVRAHKELLHRKRETKYIPNFDQYSHVEMRQALEDYFGFNCKGFSSKKIEYHFHKRIGRQVKDLLIDIGDFSYQG
jgi:retron-type reverse transcriptase